VQSLNGKRCDGGAVDHFEVLETLLDQQQGLSRTPEADVLRARASRWAFLVESPNQDRSCVRTERGPRAHFLGVA
jgi:hypothetical protein